MLNDKFVIEASCNYVYRISELKRQNSSLNKYLKDHYPTIEIVEIVENYLKTNLTVITFKDINSQELAIIFQGSTDINDWKNDNLHNFLNKNVESYQFALKYFQSLANKGHHIVYVGGNSLGGGCAQFVGLSYPLVKALCINSAPLQKITSKDTSNIYHIRVNADFLYRILMLDQDRYENGYAGSIIPVNRSLYGQYHYYNSTELAHRGSIIFPYSYLYNKYNVKTMDELKMKADSKTYLEYAQLRKAPTLAQFLSFDLITNNLNDQAEQFNLDEIQDNFAIRIKEINKSIISYHLRNLEIKLGAPFIEINDSINKELKNIIKHSLLSITKQDQTLYENIYFVIEKSTDYFFSNIHKKLTNINQNIDPNLLTNDYKKITRDLEINKQAANEIIDNLILINDSLYSFDKFEFKKLTYKYQLKEFNHYPTNFSYNYQELVYDRIDDAIKENISNNKLFIEQLENIIFLAFKAAKITLQLPSVAKNSIIQSDDIDYILKNYHLSDIFENVMELFKKDIYDTILGNSMLYIYQTNILCINEQLEQLLLTIENLESYLELVDNKLNKKLITNLIITTKKQINDLKIFNEKSL